MTRNIACLLKWPYFIICFYLNSLQWEFCKKYYDNPEFRVQTKSKFVCVLIFNFVNYGFIIWGIYKYSNGKEVDLSNFFLFVFICNLLIYFAYYVTMKKAHKEQMDVIVYILGGKHYFISTLIIFLHFPNNHKIILQK